LAKWCHDFLKWSCGNSENGKSKIVEVMASLFNWTHYGNIDRADMIRAESSQSFFSRQRFSLSKHDHLFDIGNPLARIHNGDSFETAKIQAARNKSIPSNSLGTGLLLSIILANGIMNHWTMSRQLKYITEGIGRSSHAGKSSSGKLWKQESSII